MTYKCKKSKFKEEMTNDCDFQDCTQKCCRNHKRKNELQKIQIATCNLPSSSLLFYICKELLIHLKKCKSTQEKVKSIYISQKTKIAPKIILNKIERFSI